MRARFTIVADTDNVLLIRDDHGQGHAGTDYSATVTNDAEAVVASLAPTLGGRRLFYIDSTGRMDQLLVRAGKFDGFAPL